MGFRRTLQTLIGPPAPKRPEIEAMLDAELQRHNEVMTELVQYAMQNQATTGTDNGEARRA